MMEAHTTQPDELMRIKLAMNCAQAAAEAYRYCQSLPKDIIDGRPLPEPTPDTG